MIKNLSCLSYLILVVSFKPFFVIAKTSPQSTLSRANIEKLIPILSEIYKILDEDKNILKLSWLELIRNQTAISNAYANETSLSNLANSSEQECFYGGWVSRRENQFCVSPTRLAGLQPAYEHGACGELELHCQPLLFGENLCVSVATPKDRRSVFSQCIQAFRKSNRKISLLAEEISKDEKKNKKFEQIVQKANQICKFGQPSLTGMCRALERTLNQLLPRQVVASPSALRKLKSQALPHPLKSQRSLAPFGTQEVNMGESVLKVILPQLLPPPWTCELCEAQEVKFKRINQQEKTPADFCQASGEESEISTESELRKSQGWTKRLPLDETNIPVIHEGLIQSETIKTTPQLEWLHPQEGKEVTLVETYYPIIEIKDKSGKLLRRAQSLEAKKRLLTFFPRRMLPQLFEKPLSDSSGNQAGMLLPTGEFMAWKSLAPPDWKPTPTGYERNWLVSYQGQGLWIEDFENKGESTRDPGGKSLVKWYKDGKEFSCAVASDQLWITDTTSHCTRLKAERDQDVYEVVKKNCSDFSSDFFHQK